MIDHRVFKVKSPNKYTFNIPKKILRKIIFILKKFFKNNFYWKHKGATYILILYGLVCTFGAIANLLVLVAFLRTSHLRNLRNYFIVNLAVSDLLLCVITAPVTLYFSLNLFWPFGNFACQTVSFFFFHYFYFALILL